MMSVGFLMVPKCVPDFERSHRTPKCIILQFWRLFSKSTFQPQNTLFQASPAFMCWPTRKNVFFPLVTVKNPSYICVLGPYHISYKLRRTKREDLSSGFYIKGLVFEKIHFLCLHGSRSAENALKCFITPSFWN